MKFTDAELKDATQVAYLDNDNVTNSFAYSIREAKTLNKNDQSISDCGITVPDMDNPDTGNWKVVAVYNNNPQTGFYACLIETEPGKAILAFRGSEGMEDSMDNLVHDWIEADLGLMNNTITDQQLDAETVIKYLAESGIADQYDSIAITGHSLGGNLAVHATIAATEYPELFDKITQCVSFDGPGFSEEYIVEHRKAIDKASGIITHYRWSLVGSLLNELPGVESIKLKYNAEGLGEEIAGRHATTSLEFNKEDGSAVRNPNDSEGWQHLDDFCELFSKGLDHMPGIIGNSLVFVTSSLLYVAVWSGHNFYDQEGNLTLYGQSVIAAGAALLILNPVATITFVIEAVVIVAAFFVAVCLYEIVYEAVEKIVAMVVDAAIEFYHMAAEAAEKFKQYVAQKLREFKEWCQKTFNAGYKYASQHTCIQIDTDKMRQYGAILREVNRKLNEIDRRMDRLYRSLKLGDQAKLMRADIRTGYSLRLGRCASYLEDTASEFATVESNLIKIL